MTGDATTLSLSDILRTSPPSPAPKSSPRSSSHRSPSPCDLQDDEIKKIRDRISEMGFAMPPDSLGNPSLSPREKELVDMILRLTSHIRPDASQLLQQAELISALVRQRNYLIMQAKEQCGLWECEREGWERSAEALVVQRNKAGSSTARDEALGKQMLSYSLDNKQLREKLTETQSRLLTLESELLNLRPLLLIKSNSQQRGALNVKSKGRGRRHAGTPPPDAPVAVRECDIHDHKALSASTTDGVSTTRPYYRSRQSSIPIPPSTSRTKRKTKQASPVASSRAPLLDDARTEHILLAARRIGRQRTGILSGILVHQEQGENNNEGKNAHSSSIPAERTSPSGRATTATFVYVNTPGAVQPDVWEPYNMKTAHASTHDSSAVHGSRSTPTVHPKQRSFVKTQSGLDSLVSAARSMLDTEDDGWPRESDCDRSPKPKRRRLSTVEEESRPKGGLTRVKSALDVLADHAAGLSAKGTGTSVHVTLVDGRKGKEKTSDVDSVNANSNIGTNLIARTHLASPTTNALTTGDDKQADSAEIGTHGTDKTSQIEVSTRKKLPTTAFGISPNSRPITALQNGTNRAATPGNIDDASKERQEIGLDLAYGGVSLGRRAETGQGLGLTTSVDGEILPLKSGLEPSLVSDFPAVILSSLSAVTRSPIPPTPPSPILLPAPPASHPTPMSLSRANSSTPAPEHDEDDGWLPPRPELISFRDSDSHLAPGNDMA